MSAFDKLLSALSAIIPVVLLVSGCALNKPTQGGETQSVDCRVCHSPGGAAGARDFSSIYANPKVHHPVGIQYPVGSKSDSAFNVPNGRGAGVTFFDVNGDGLPDSNEVQLFGAMNEPKVECSSCHKSHALPPTGGKPANLYYLRIDNANSALCVTCHNN